MCTLQRISSKVPPLFEKFYKMHHYCIMLIVLIAIKPTSSQMMGPMMGMMGGMMPMMHGMMMPMMMNHMQMMMGMMGGGAVWEL
uniref:Uncharacterized protein n=1 Tax=Haemonchus contortus TaxID=6289 RepID=A0A7I4YH06_HAECO